MLLVSPNTAYGQPPAPLCAVVVQWGADVAHLAHHRGFVSGCQTPKIRLNTVSLRVSSPESLMR